MNVFNKLAKLATICGEATIDYFKTSAQMYELGGELARDLIVELKESTFGEALRAIRAPLVEAIQTNKDAKEGHKLAWKNLSQALREEISPELVEDKAEDEVENADLVN